MAGNVYRKAKREIKIKSKATSAQAQTFAKLVKSKPVVKRSKEYGKEVMDTALKGSRSIASNSRYEFVKEIGEGAQGAVFIAHQVSELGIKKRIAIKVLRDHFDDKAIRRLVTEAKLLQRLTQGHVVEMLALETMKGANGKKNFMLVEELIDGQSMEKFNLLHNKKNLLMNPVIVGFTLNQAALALDEAHNLTDDNGKALNLVHRSLAPSNILYNEKAGKIKLSDFGMAIANDKELSSNKLRGNPAYMAPEQFSGESTSASDIWALGVVGYQALTGFLPYPIKGKNNMEIINDYSRQARFKLRAPHEILNVRGGHYKFENLSKIIMKCLHMEPSKRPTADDLHHILSTKYLYASGFGPTSRTIAAYMKLIGEMPADPNLVVSDIKLDDDTNKIIDRTLYIDKPVQAVCYRQKGYYQPDFIKAINAKDVNPCLKHTGGVAYMG